MGELISAVFCIGEGAFRRVHVLIPILISNKAMLFLRVFAIWRESKLVLAFLTILLLVSQLADNSAETWLTPLRQDLRGFSMLQVGMHPTL